MGGDDNGRFLTHKRVSFSLYSMTLSVCFCSQLLLSGSCVCLCRHVRIFSLSVIVDKCIYWNKTHV